METMEQEKNIQAPSWTPFVERSFWGRVKATYAFVWGNKLTLSCFAVPFVLLITVLPVNSMSNLALSIIFFAVLTICSLLKEYGQLDGISKAKWRGRFGNVFLEQLVYGIIMSIVIGIPLFIFIVIYLVICVVALDISKENLLELQTWVNLFLLSIPVIVLSLCFRIVIDFGAVNVSIHNRNTDSGFNSLKYAWRILKGNWWCTIGFFFVCGFFFCLVFIVCIALFVLLENVGICNTDILTEIGSSVLAVFCFMYYYVPMIYQFEHLRSKYEKKQAEEAALTEAPAEQEPEA